MHIEGKKENDGRHDSKIVRPTNNKNGAIINLKRKFRTRIRFWENIQRSRVQRLQNTCWILGTVVSDRATRKLDQPGLL